MSSSARNEKGAMSLRLGMRECAEGGEEGSPSLVKDSYLSPRSSEWNTADGFQSGRDVVHNREISSCCVENEWMGRSETEGRGFH